MMKVTKKTLKLQTPENYRAARKTRRESPLAIILEQMLMMSMMNLAVWKTHSTMSHL